MKMRELLLWTVLAVLAVFIWEFSRTASPSGREIPFAEFMTRVNAGAIREVAISGRRIAATTKAKERVVTDAPEDPATLVPQLLNHGIQLEVKPEAPRGGMLGNVLFLYTSTILPWFTFVLVLVVFARLRALERRIEAQRAGGDREDPA